MGAILTRIDDPRDNLMKMTRDELYAYGKQNGIEFPQGPDTPAFDITGRTESMVSILRARGLPGRDMSHRVLGMEQPLISELAPYRNQILPKAPPPPATKRSWDEGEKAAPVEKMTMGQLRKECKSRGIKMDRRDNMNTLRDKLRVQNPS